MVGIIYLGTVLVVGMLLLVASKQHHESHDECEIFRFPTILVRALQVGSFVPILVGIGIYTSFPNKPGPIEIAILSIVFGSMTVIVLASAIFTARFRSVIGSHSMIVHDHFSDRVVNFTDVRQIVIARPWRGRGRLELFGEHGKRLCKLDGGIQDFDDMTDAIERRCSSHIPVREQDTNGKWSQRSTS